MHASKHRQRSIFFLIKWENTILWRKVHSLNTKLILLTQYTMHYRFNNHRVNLKTIVNVNCALVLSLLVLLLLWIILLSIKRKKTSLIYWTLIPSTTKPNSWNCTVLFPYFLEFASPLFKSFNYLSTFFDLKANILYKSLCSTITFSFY